MKQALHLDIDPTCGGYTTLQFGDRFWSVLTVPHAQRTLLAGFTTVRNVGADAWNDVGLRLGWKSRRSMPPMPASVALRGSQCWKRESKACNQSR